MDEMHAQFLNAYRLSAQLIIDKEKYLEEFLDEFRRIDNKFSKMNMGGIKQYLESLTLKNISEEEKEKEILTLGKQFWGGLKNNERIFLLEMYLLNKGTLRKNALVGTVSKLHETILKLIAIIMQSNLWIKREMAIHPNVALLQSIYRIMPQIDEYREIIKLEEYYIAKADTTNLVLQIDKEKKLNEKVDSEIISIIQKYNSKIEGFKQSLIQKYAPIVEKDSRFLLRVGFMTVLLTCVMYTSAAVPDSGMATNRNLPAQSANVAAFTPDFPTKDVFRITALFGDRNIRKGSKNHKGIDVGCPTGTKIYAISDGVIKVLRGSGYGRYVVIEHANGYTSVYAHLSKVPKEIKSGMIVKKGDLIALSGNSGTSTGPHLHFEIRKNDVKINPLLMYTQMLAILQIKETVPNMQKESYAQFVSMLNTDSTKTM